MDYVSRRLLLRSAVGAVGAGLGYVSLSPSGAWAQASPSREIAFNNLHTGETIKRVYVEQGQYVPSVIAELNQFLRDWRTGDVHEIDPVLFDQLHALQQRVETPGAFNVICGYRSPQTNAMLHEKSEGVATHSLHIEGKAMDISLPGKDLAQLHQAALSLQAGGVGYYPTSGFIHMDTGRVRRWG